ncbi:putative disease resistance RPP13-like protein 1 isoform X2 [Hevea brasiliensis]|nr:putative disease resistance RPP13-like protein 1 isoform X2 [Hevea brasiliensis]
MEVVGEAILSALLKPLVKKLTSSELLKFAREKQIQDELRKWESKLLEIHAVVNDAEEKQITNPAAKIWLSKLRDLAYDVEDILDEFETKALGSKLKAKSKASTITAQKQIPVNCYGLKSGGAIPNVKKGNKLREITTRLQNLATEKNDLNLRTSEEGRSIKENERVPTTSLLKERNVYGRENDKEAILQLLMSDEASDSRFSVIPIIGMGGVGKTTLAQLIYNDNRVQFGYKAWVCVSNDFDILKITKTILHCENYEANDFNSLQVRLKEKLSAKRFLIVLDDVWSEKYEDWTTLCSPFASGAPGSRVIVTTRIEGVAKLMGTVDPYTLKELSYDDCLSLFTRHALEAKNFDAHPELAKIGQAIVKKCKGLPLAAKTLGGLLRGKQRFEEWEYISNSDIWDLPEEKSGILPALRLSYHHLPSHLKQCFVYCAIFPNDYEFDKSELVLLWMAEGFLHQPNKKKHMKDLGCKYFDDLLSRSFFQQSTNDKSRYVMHDLVSDLARFVGREICFQLEDKSEGEKSYPEIRHSSFSSHYNDIEQRFEVFYEMKNLRTFLALPYEQYGNLSSKVLHDLVPKLKCLRVLSLASYFLLELPSSIGALIHLRYLDLSQTGIERLPESITELFNLQTLRLYGCERLIKLPVGISNLVNLCHLDIGGTSSLQELPPHIGNLKNLCVLPKFIVGEGSGVGIKELMKLSDLQGHLHICGLHNVANVQDAKYANLKEKQGLCELTLEWDYFSGSRNEGHELQVLNSLRPHQNLEKLYIEGYGGSKFPLWIEDSAFTNMVELNLRNCHKITSIPQLGHLPLLRYLRIQGMDEVKTVGVEFYGDRSLMKGFPSLETLYVGNMPEWEQWSWSTGDHEGTAGKYPKLRELTVSSCPKLIGKLPRCLPSLETLSIDYCPQLEDLPEMLPALRELDVDDCREVVFKSVSDLPSLTTLNIQGISGLISLDEVLIQALVSLKHLKIACCEELRYLWRNGTNLNKLDSLKSLEISGCPQLVSLVGGEDGLLPSNLETLQIGTCDNLEQLPHGLGSLTSLKNLEIDDCKSLVSLLKREEELLPCNLENLLITRCWNLEKLPNSLGNLASLRNLEIYECPKLVSIPATGLPSSLRSLNIFACNSLEYLPEISHLEKFEISNSLEYLASLSPFAPRFQNWDSQKRLEIYNCSMQLLEFLHEGIVHLTYLELIDCPALESFPDGGLYIPTLTSFTIQNCENLKFLPNQMQILTSLQNLEINNCGIDSFPEEGLPPNLIKLYISDCNNLTQPMSEWGLHALTSLREFEIYGRCTEVISFPDDDGLLLPASLIRLYIGRFKNLKSISSGLQNLSFLRTLYISNCPKLRFLPKEGFPATLEDIEIRSCHLLSKRLNQKRDYWPLIAHIPRVEVDGARIHEMKREEENHLFHFNWLRRTIDE